MRKPPGRRDAPFHQARRLHRGPIRDEPARPSPRGPAAAAGRGAVHRRLDAARRPARRGPPRALRPRARSAASMHGGRAGGAGGAGESTPGRTSRRPGSPTSLAWPPLRRLPGRAFGRAIAFASGTSPSSPPTASASSGSASPSSSPRPAGRPSTRASGSRSTTSPSPPSPPATAAPEGRRSGTTFADNVSFRWEIGDAQGHRRGVRGRPPDRPPARRQQPRPALPPRGARGGRGHTRTAAGPCTSRPRCRTA